MQEALGYIYEIFTQFNTWVFSCYLFNGVSLGWLIVSAFIFMVLIKTFISLPRSAPRSRISYTDRNGEIHK